MPTGAYCSPVIIVAGHRTSRKEMGLVADFCPVCRDFRAFHVTEVRKVAHLYWVPVGRGKTQVRELQCRVCASVMGTTDRDYPAYSKTFRADVVELARETNPDIMSLNRARLELEDRLAEGKLARADRDALIAEPFLVLNYMVHKKWPSRGSMPVTAGVAIIAALFLIPAAIATWVGGSGRMEPAVILTGLAGLALLTAVVSIVKGPGKWVRRHIHPRLVAALLPLDPAPEEVARVLEEVRRGKLTIGRRVKPAELSTDLARARSGAGRRG